MNYFDLFGLPIRLKVDRAEAHRRYIELSKQYHPDYHAGQGDERQSEVLEIAASLNKGLKTFQQPDETIKYVLQLKGLLVEEEKYDLPPAFLMEVLEINEQLMDMEGPADQEALKETLLQLQLEIYEPVKEIVEGYQEGNTSEEELLQVKEYYYKKKYLDRIGRQLAGKP